MSRKKLKPRNFVAKDLFTDKYHMRVVSVKKIYNRKKVKSNLYKEMIYASSE